MLKSNLANNYCKQQIKLRNFNFWMKNLLNTKYFFSNLGTHNQSVRPLKLNLVLI